MVTDMPNLIPPPPHTVRRATGLEPPCGAGAGTALGQQSWKRRWPDEMLPRTGAVFQLDGSLER